MKTITRTFISFSAIVVLVGCEVVADMESVEEVTGYLVVEGQITNERTLHTVVLSESSGINSQGEPRPVSAASVRITDGEIVISLTEGPVAGVYTTVDTVQGQPGKVYTLEIVVGNTEYVATDTMPAVPMIQLLTYVPDVEPDVYTWTVPNDHSIKPGTTYETNVRFIHPTNDGMTDTTDITYYNFTGLNAAALFSLNKMSRVVRLTRGTKIIQRKYGLSDRYYKFLKAIYLETDWRGGLYDVTPVNAPTNVLGGGVGFFRAASVSVLEQQVE